MTTLLVENTRLRAMVNCNRVSVFQARHPERAFNKEWFLIGNGQWSGSKIIGSGVDWVELVDLEEKLREKLHDPSTHGIRHLI